MGPGCVWRGAVCGALFVLGGLPGALPAQEVYKSTDTEGHVVYSDRAPTKSASKTTLHLEQPNPTEVARLVKEQQLLTADDLERQKQQAASNRNRAAADQAKQQKCDKARNNYFRLKDSGRLYRLDENGDRVFLTDSEADAKRSEAQRAMTAACGS